MLMKMQVNWKLFGVTALLSGLLALTPLASQAAACQCQTTQPTQCQCAQCHCGQ